MGIIGFSSLGCTTKDLWQDEKISNHYQETIISFYTDKKNQNIVFIGKKHHYIFDKGTSDFITLLDNKKMLNLQKDNIFIITSILKNKITSRISVTFNDNNLSPQQKIWLEKSTYNKGINYYSKNYILKGMRYKADIKVNQYAQKLHQPIKLKITEYTRSTDSKVLMTPLAITADVGLTLLSVVLLPIIFLQLQK
jgi:hypothetical protein